MPTVGRCPPPAAAELLDRASFHEYNFLQLFGSEHREDDYESNTRGFWLRRRAAARRLIHERARHRQDRASHRPPGKTVYSCQDPLRGKAAKQLAERGFKPAEDDRDLQQ